MNSPAVAPSAIACEARQDRSPSPGTPGEGRVGVLFWSPLPRVAEENREVALIDLTSSPAPLPSPPRGTECNGAPTPALPRSTGRGGSRSSALLPDTRGG